MDGYGVDKHKQYAFGFGRTIHGQPKRDGVIWGERPGIVHGDIELAAVESGREVVEVDTRQIKGRRDMFGAVDPADGLRAGRLGEAARGEQQQYCRGQGALESQHCVRG